MPISQLRFFRRCAEFLPKENIQNIPPNTRGIYILLREVKPKEEYKVVYVGMAGGNKTGANSRLNAHKKSKTKHNKWTHFSLFEVWDNITKAEIREIEGLLRHIFRKDSDALPLNVANKFKSLSKVRDNCFKNW